MTLSSDLIPVSAQDIYLGLAAVYHKGLWPLPVVGVVVAIALWVAVFLRPSPLTDVIVEIILDLMWLGIGAVWFVLKVGPAFGWGYVGAAVFILQSTVFLAAAVFGAVSFTKPRRLFPLAAGGFIALVAAAGYPVGAWLMGRRGVEIGLVGTAAGPTALFTLGFILATTERPSPLLITLPTLWVLGAGVYLATTLGLHEELILAGGAAAGIAAWLYIYLQPGRTPTPAASEGAPPC